MNRSLSIAVLAVLAANSAARAQSVAVPKTNHTPVYVHYMPWFETPATLGANNWGWHWTMNNQNPNVIGTDGKRQIASYYYPQTGPYASSDKDIIEYQLLLMKLSGIDGVILDWYGSQGSNGDINSLLNNSNLMANSVGKYGLKVGVMLEDRYARSVNDTAANVAYLRDHYFNNPNYIRMGPNKDPMMMIFGPTQFQQPSQWTQIMSNAGGPTQTLPIQYQSNQVGASASGEFSWVYQDPGTSDHATVLQNYLSTRSNQVATSVGAAYPGFQDFYAAGGAGAGPGFVIPPNNGGTLAQTLALDASYKNNIDAVQLETWNDYGEGTMLEPTLQTGYTYLKQIQQFTGTPYGETELAMVYTLYQGRKSLSSEQPASAQLDRAANALNSLDFTTASNALRLASATAQIDRLFKSPSGPVVAISAPYDFNGDGKIVTTIGAPASDSDYWVTVLNHTHYGDANLDGKVDFDDLVIVAQNYGTTPRTLGWVDGSFNGDGLVTFDDLVLLAQNYNITNPMTAGQVSALGSGFASDFALARSLVPEPATFGMLCGFAMLTLRRRRA